MQRSLRYIQATPQDLEWVTDPQTKRKCQRHSSRSWMRREAYAKYFSHKDQVHFPTAPLLRVASDDMSKPVILQLDMPGSLSPLTLESDHLPSKVWHQVEREHLYLRQGSGPTLLWDRPGLQGDEPTVHPSTKGTGITLDEVSKIWLEPTPHTGRIPVERSIHYVTVDETHILLYEKDNLSRDGQEKWSNLPHSCKHCVVPK